MPKMGLQSAQSLGVADAGLGIVFGGVAANHPLDNLQPGTADDDLAADPVELLPRG